MRGDSIVFDFKWYARRDSNPDSQPQKLMSYQLDDTRIWRIRRESNPQYPADNGA